MREFIKHVSEAVISGIILSCLGYLGLLIATLYRKHSNAFWRIIGPTALVVAETNLAYLLWKTQFASSIPLWFVRFNWWLMFICLTWRLCCGVWTYRTESHVASIVEWANTIKERHRKVNELVQQEAAKGTSNDIINTNVIKMLLADEGARKMSAMSWRPSWRLVKLVYWIATTAAIAWVLIYMLATR